MSDVALDQPALRLALFAVAILVLAAVVAWLFRHLTRRPAFAYQRTSGLFTPAELRFLEVLKSLLPPTSTVMGKVRMADLLEPAKGMSQKAFFDSLTRVACKHVDFVVCDARTYHPLYVVELDDSSHRHRSRSKRDRFVDAALQDAGLPIVRVPVKRVYDPQVISDLIRSSLAKIRRP
jgi:Protein of unknown function (DUF2726).